MAIAGVIVFIEAIGTGLIQAAMPRSAGQYVHVGRCLGGIFGVMEGYRSFIENAGPLGINYYIAATSLLGTLATLGMISGNLELSSVAGGLMANPWALFSIAAIIGLIGFIGDFFGLKVGMRIMMVGTIITVVGTLLGIGLMYSFNPADLPARWDALIGAGAYQEVVNIAQQNGWVHSEFSWGAITSSLFVPVSLCWPYNLQIIAGEVSQPKRNLPLVNIISAVILILLFTGIGTSYEHAFGDFGKQYVFIINSGLAGQFKINRAISPSIAVYASMLTDNLLISSWIGFVPVVVAFTGLPGWYYYSTRPLFALSFDRYAPAVFAHLNRWGAPLWGDVFTLGFSYFWLGLCLMGIPYVMTVSFMITYIMIRWWWALSEIALPFTRPEIWREGPRLTIRGFPVIAIVGIIMFFLHGFALFSGAYDTLSIVASLLVYLIGSILYVVYSHWNRKKGIEPAEIFSLLPPE
jgi:amino acid transporter